MCYCAPRQPSDEIDEEHANGDIYEVVAAMLREPASRLPRGDDGAAHRTLRALYGVDSRDKPWEMRRAGASGAGRCDPGHPVLSSLTMQQRGAVLRMIEDACVEAVKADRLSRPKPLFTEADISALAGIARMTDDARRLDLEERAKALDAASGGPYPEGVLKVDLVSVFLEDGMPTMLLMPVSGRPLRARLKPSLLGSLIAGLGLLVGSIVASR